MNILFSLGIIFGIGGAFVGYLMQINYIKGADPPPKIVGVDLGTTYSAIALYHPASGSIDVVPDPYSRRETIPSIVSFDTNMTVYVGYAAQERIELFPERTIYDAKRFVGRTFEIESNEFKMLQRRYPFKIGLWPNGTAYFEILQTIKSDGTVLGKAILHQISPSQIGAYILMYLRDATKKHSGIDIHNCVITAPAEFDTTRRNSTALAASLAGLKVVTVVSEPTAAALAYGVHKRENVNTIVVVDLGGGTLDVSILWLQGGTFVTIALAGNNRLGGQDINELLLKHLLDVINLQRGRKITDAIYHNARDKQSLRAAIEAAKIALSSSSSSIIHLDELESMSKFEYKLTRDEFERVCEPLMQQILEPVKAAMEDAQISTSEVDEIVLVGGSTLVPRVRQIIGLYFGKAPVHGISAELAVVLGAAHQAGVVSGGWPLKVSAIELPAKAKKRHVYTNDANDGDFR